MDAIRADDEDEPLVPVATSSLDLDHRRKGATFDVERAPGETAGEATLSAGDVDVDATYASTIGDEAPGGDNPTPGQDVVDLIGRSLGVEYNDDEELRGADKITDRDKHRWELDPASAEDYRERSR